MPELSAGDKSNLRTRPVGRTWNFYVYQPETIWTGTVGGSPSRGDRTLTVSTVTGDPTSIWVDSTVRVTDSSDDQKDYPSRVRFKSYDAGEGEMTVADNNIDWASGDKLTSVRLFEIWPRHLYIDSNGDQHKDRTEAYVDDATAQPPKANAGPAVIATLSSGQVDVTFKDEDSYIVPTGGAVSSYLWSDIGGSPSVEGGAEGSSTVTYRYSSAGYYYVRLTVTDANSKTGHVYVPVIIDDGTLALARTERDPRSGDVNGWRMNLRLLGLDGDEDALYDGAPCFLAADTAQTASGAFVDNRSNLRWSGWLIEDETAVEKTARTIRYRAVSSGHVLGNVPAYPVGLRSDASPANWYELSSLCVDSAVYHLLRWHSTICEVADVHMTGEWANRTSQGEDCTAKDLLSQVNDVLKKCFGNMRCDRQGILRAMRDEWHLSDSEESARATVMTLANSDIFSARYGPRPHRAKVREVRASGVDGSGNPYFSGAPGAAPLDGGKPEEKTKLAANDQTELNQWAAQELALRNWSVPLVLKMAGEYDCVDPALGEYVDGTLSGFDDKLPDGPYAVRGVRFTEVEPGLTVGEWELLPDPSAYGAYPGETRTPPTSPDPPDPPDLPDPDDYPDIIPPLEWPSYVFVATEDGFYYCTDFPNDAYNVSTQPTWVEHSTGLPAEDIRQGGHDPGDPQNYHYVIMSGRDVYRRVSEGDWALSLESNGAGASTAESLVDAEWSPTSPENGQLEWIAHDESNEGHVYAIFMGGSGSGCGWYLLRSTDYGANWAAHSEVRPTGNPGSGYFKVDGNYIYVHGKDIADDYYWVSTDGGANYEKTTAKYDELHNINELDPTICFCEYSDLLSGVKVLDSSYLEEELYGLTPAAEGGRLYFDPNNINRQWGVHKDSTYFYKTVDAWESLAATYEITMDAYAITTVLEKVHATSSRFVFFGADTNSDDATPEHLLITETDADAPGTFVGKSGDMADSSPFTDSIPYSDGDTVRDGVWVAF